MQSIKNWESIVVPNDSPNGPATGQATMANLRYSDVVEMSHTSSSQQAAIQTLTQGIAMMDAIEGPGALALGNAVRRIVPHIVESAMVLGYAPWRPDQDGLPPIARPGDVVIVWRKDQGNPANGHWAPKAAESALGPRGTGGWHLEIIDPPCPPPRTSGVDCIAETPALASMLMSPCARSYSAAARQQLIEHQWLNRDRFNSAPSAFTFIRRDLGNTGGKLRPWPRDVNAGVSSNLHTSSVGPDNASDFRTLISRRAETIRGLSAQTAKERDTYARRAAIKMSTTAMGRAGAAFGPVPTDHSEFAVSDGKEMTAAPMLLSTIDGHLHFSKARHTVLVLCGVPPQAIGESVNSERNASNHRQYEVAMGLFHASLRRMRQLINSILEKCGIDVKFVATTPIHNIDALAPILTTGALHRKLAGVHNIEMTDLNPAAIKQWQSSLLEAPQTGSKRSKGVDDPSKDPMEGRDSGLEKKRAKRNHVEPEP